MSFECYRDAWGIPHLRAPDPLSLAFAQGRNAAADRAWQLETLRRRATGTASALLGGEWRHWDRLVRQVGVPTAARSVLDGLDPATAEWVRAYVAGVNAALPEAAAAAPEFDSAPGPWEPWTPLAVWYAEHLLFGSGFPAKLWRERVAAHLGEDAVARFAMDGPEPVGSNGWLVDGSLTATGHPILAGDPHRFLQLPGAYQQIRLACTANGPDGFDVVGLAMPGIPGIAHFGHTGGVAWGITNAMADTQDLFLERLRRNDDGSIEAFGPDGWEPAASRTETIEVAGGAPATIEVVTTARGPIVAEDADGALSLRGPLQVRSDLGFAALPKLLRARTVADVDAALDGWVSPVNVVMAADTAGGLLHRAAGRVPERDAANRVRPVPAWEPRYAWRGWRPMPRGRVDRLAAMANDRGVAAPLGVEFCPPHRADRIRELLETRTDWAAADMASIHTDTFLPSAGILLDRLPRLDLGGPAARLRDRLLAWDRRMDADSTDAAAFAAVRTAFIRNLAELPVFAPLADPSGHPAIFAPWLALSPRIGFALGPLLDSDLIDAEEQDAALTAALADAAARAPVTWGEVHRLVPWRDVPGEEPEALAGVAGDADCVLATSGVPGVTETFLRGPAARWVWDLADREQSRWIVPFGASGVPGPHFRDQFPLWRRGELVPVVTDWQQLHEEHRMIDRPAVFERTAEDFGRVAIVPVRPVEDLDLIYGWVTEERARFWGMTAHSREKVLEIYEFLDSLDTHHAFLILRDGEPIALFQTYEPDADPVGECYAFEPGDIGAHLLIASSRGNAQAGFTGALMRVITAYLFDDPKHLRVVAEPDSRNEQAAARLRRTGFTLGPEVRLPDKTARLAFLRREDVPAELT
ncbi:GNAT family N-acetyltransferase [Glycomyces sp. TRM65418]|uniref:GNAT family N-acetyltransferase n=1 Tax=Glycomyces sp. TRM65418 TaxID=2867006 RepID=UPI001CE6A19A|nr:GNAT family N-acetyltransferase [Glycomyces sp. TRM65418]MCC3765641.1 GNAT family N-acetyltransferase [Glycomyces sp. TRM65418]QZD55239.1 GNAT family N-acetyltransferase [Glycomyces sp. TRM65418]